MHYKNSLQKYIKFAYINLCKTIFLWFLFLPYKESLANNCLNG